MKTMILGNGGRESALAWRMAQDSTVYAMAAHRNPTLIHMAAKTGGVFETGNILDPVAVAAFATKHGIDLVMVSSDEPLAAGVVDELLAQGIKTVGPTRDGSEIEWNKSFSRELVEQVAPEANPFYRIAYNPAQVEAVFAARGDAPVAIKPVGLTGGKGVKVVGPHLKDNAQAKDYALELLAIGNKHGTENCVIIEEKMVGAEFTIQAISDGRTVVFPRTTFDYPYRYEGDTGPGTGGMGSYCGADIALGFMDTGHYREACDIITRVITHLTETGRHFTGVMNSGFFLTDKGEVKVIEFNARFGDPECMNIMLLLDNSWCDVMTAITAKELSSDTVAFRDGVSQVVYLVSPDYALPNPPKSYEFEIDVAAIRQSGCEVFFASAEHVAGNTYRTVGTSRCVAIGATAATLEETRARIAAAIGAHVKGPLEWRTDMGSDDNINDMKKLVAA